MTSQASPLASLTATLERPLEVRPAVPLRTASASTLPTRSTLPRIHLALLAENAPELAQGLAELADHAVRDNVRVVDSHDAVASASGDVWLVRCARSFLAWRAQADLCEHSFEHRTDFIAGALAIEPSHNDFTAVPDGEQFSITVSYNRPIEGKAKSRLQPLQTAGAMQTRRLDKRD